MGSSVFGRIWSAIKPPPAVCAAETSDPELKRRQRRLLKITGAIIVLVGGGGAAYDYIASAQQRAEGQYQEGMRLMGPGSYREAIARFDRALQISPRFAEAYLGRGSAHQIVGETDSALADFNRALDLNPDLARAYTARGTIYRDRGDVKGAMAEFARSIQAEPTVDAYYERGQTYESLGEHQKAIDDYDLAIALLRDAPFVYRARSIARRNLGDIAGYKADRDKANGIERPARH